MGRKLTAKWTVETAEEWKEAMAPRPPYSPEFIHYWKLFLMHADLLCGYTHTVWLKRRDSGETTS